MIEDDLLRFRVFECSTWFISNISMEVICAGAGQDPCCLLLLFLLMMMTRTRGTDPSSVVPSEATFASLPSIQSLHFTLLHLHTPSCRGAVIDCVSPSPITIDRDHSERRNGRCCSGSLPRLPSHICHRQSFQKKERNGHALGEYV